MNLIPSYILDYSYAGLPTTENGNPEYEWYKTNLSKYSDEQ